MAPGQEPFFFVRGRIRRWESTHAGAIFEGGQEPFIKKSWKQQLELQVSQVYIKPNFAGKIPAILSPENHGKGGK